MTRSHARQLDQFYTDRSLADRLAGVVLARLADRGVAPASLPFLEPSAGEGAFVDALLTQAPQARVAGCDLDPKHPLAVRQDFFERPASPLDERWVVLGNPPFGKNATLAVRFFNHAEV